MLTVLAEHFIQLVARDAVLLHGYIIDTVGVMHIYNGKTGEYEFTKVMLTSQFSEVWIRFTIPYSAEEYWDDDIAAQVRQDINKMIDTVIQKAEADPGQPI